MELIEHLRTWDEIPDDDGKAFHWLDLKTGEAADLIEKQAAELEAAMVEIEQEKSVSELGHLLFAKQLIANDKLREQLAAEQANSAKLRGVLDSLVKSSAACRLHFETDHAAATEALSTPSDTSALEAMIAKAGEVMRERIRIAGTQGWLNKEVIRALPGVTLDDLKGGA